MTFQDICEAFPDAYGSGDESAKRMFERDKEELQELGLKLSFQPPDEDEPSGYRVDRDSYYLPKIDWTGPELTALYTVGSAALAAHAFPGGRDLSHALRKMSFFGPIGKAKDIQLDFGGDAEQVADTLNVLWDALHRRKVVTLSYYSPQRGTVESREVEPYSIILRFGVWCLIAFCRLRQARRLFVVHRIQSAVTNSQKPKSKDYEIPKDFNTDDWTPRWPWEYRYHAPIEVTLELAPRLVPLAEGHFGVPVSAEHPQLSITVRNLNGLISYLLSLRGLVSIVSPDNARERFCATAECIARTHGALL